MFDFFGIASRARVKALEEQLAVERARGEALMKQVFALADTKALRAITPQEPRPTHRVSIDTKPPLRDIGTAVSAAREMLSKRES